ncbi:MAG: hypothetical protein AB7G11_17930 [Phycisphaerales bacterium]
MKQTSVMKSPRASVVMGVVGALLGGGYGLPGHFRAAVAGVGESAA